MFAKTYGATTLEIDGRIIDVEVDVSPGLPGFELVGLPDRSVKESKKWVRTVIMKIQTVCCANIFRKDRILRIFRRSISKRFLMN